MSFFFLHSKTSRVFVFFSVPWTTPWTASTASWRRGLGVGHSTLLQRRRAKNTKTARFPRLSFF